MMAFSGSPEIREIANREKSLQIVNQTSFGSYNDPQYGINQNKNDVKSQYSSVKHATSKLSSATVDEQMK